MAVKRTGCYERVSTEEQAKYGYSIQTQIDNLEEYCKENNLKIVDHYTDEGISGAKPPLKRPALNRLIEDVKAGKIDLIVFTKLDRWFRSVKEYHKVQEILDQYGVQWVTIHEEFNTTTADGILKINLYLAIAQNERDKAAERVTTVLEHKRKNKEACFGGQAVPMGYIKQRDENGVMRLVKDPETMEIVQEFWDILIKENNLNKAIRNMGKYGYIKDWKSWAYMTHSDFYCGIHRGVEDYCEPYVSPEDFNRYQQRKPFKNTPSGRVYLFRSLIRCPVCGQKLCGDGNKKPGKTYKSYRCTNRTRGCSIGGSISERKLERELLDRLDDLIKDEIAKVEVEKAKPKKKPKTNIKALKEKQRRLTVAYMAGNIPDDQYLKEDADLKAEIKKAEAEAPPEPKDITPLKELLETDFRSLYVTFTEEEKQRFWQGLIKQIIVDENRKIKEVIFF